MYQNNNRICAHVQNKNHISLAGECFIDDVFIGYETVNGEWDTIIATITSNAYISVIKQFDTSVLRHVQCFVLVSPTIGSNSLVNSFLNQSGCSAEVVSFSTYYAATERRNSVIEVLTTNVKKKIYVGSTHKDSEASKKLIYLLQQFGIIAELVKSPCEAESRNISIYVHPPIFMNEYALKSIFRENKTIIYGYKFYPEGPLTQYVMHDLLRQWKEIMDIIHHFEVEGFNLLKFMIDDNYPVRPESLSRDDIENFTSFNVIKQEYLLYIRYTSILIDPFSTPDERGRYFDFSAVPIRGIYQDGEGYWHIPRIPKEDYYRIKILQGIARNVSLQVPTINKMIDTYEKKLRAFSQANQEYLLSDDFVPKCFDDETAMICKNKV